MMSLLVIYLSWVCLYKCDYLISGMMRDTGMFFTQQNAAFLQWAATLEVQIKQSCKKKKLYKRKSLRYHVCWYGDAATEREGKKSEAEANWTVRNARICPLQRNPDSCKEDTSGHLIMQIPKVHWPFQPEATLSVTARSSTEGHAGVEKNENMWRIMHVMLWCPQTSYWYVLPFSMIELQCPAATTACISTWICVACSPLVSPAPSTILMLEIT